MQQIYRRTFMPKCNFNKVAKQLIELNSLKTFQSTRTSMFGSFYRIIPGKKKQNIRVFITNS